MGKGRERRKRKEKKLQRRHERESLEKQQATIQPITSVQIQAQPIDWVPPIALASNQ